MTDVTWKGSATLRGMLRPLASLTRDPENARVHNTRNLKAIATSLERFGQVLPILADEHGTIVGGNGTHECAEYMGWTHIAVVSTTDLTAEERKALALALNKTAELAEWDFQAVAAAFRALPADLHLVTGFAAFEIEPMLQATWKPPVANDAPPPQPTDGHAPDMVVFKATPDQAEIIKGALAQVREQTGEATMSDGRALELICADYLSGA